MKTLRILIAISLVIVPNVWSSYGPVLEQPNPKNLIIAFDLHGVILKTNYRQIFNHIKQMPHKWLFIKALPGVFGQFMKSERNAVYELYFDYLFSRARDKELLINDLITLTNMQRINENTIEIMRELKNAGYTIVLASNIGEIIYNNLLQQPAMAEIMKLFDAIFIPRPINGYAHKPEKRYFDMLHTAYPHKQILLIDDSPNKLCGAAENGITGIRFTNPENLTRSLAEMHILFMRQRY